MGRTLRAVLPLASGLIVTMVFLLLTGRGKHSLAAARPENAGREAQGAAVRYVAVTGADSGGCTDPDSPCRTPQYAVDQSGDGDEIRVATGVYTGVQARPRDDSSTSGLVSQVVYISASLHLRGGYTLTDWTNPDPNLYPTTLDAEGEDRVVYVVTGITATLEGLNITNGSVNSQPINDGGGVFAYASDLTIRNSRIGENEAIFGAGIHLHEGRLTVRDSIIENNLGGVAIDARYDEVSLLGNLIQGNSNRGGVFIEHSTAVISNNQIIDNYHNFFGGGIQILYEDSLVVNNIIAGNEAGDNGGGLMVVFAESSTIMSNTIQGNSTAGGFGAGFYVFGDGITIKGNDILSNTSVYRAGGGLLGSSTLITVENNLIAGNTAGADGGGIVSQGIVLLRGNQIIDNQADSVGGGVEQDFGFLTAVNNIFANNKILTEGGAGLLLGSDARLLHNTFSGNSGGDGSAITVFHGAPAPRTVHLTNTIIVSHTVGISVETGSTAHLEATLWGAGQWANGVDWGGGGAILTGTTNLWGDPGFIDPASGDYHIGPASDARDAGIDAGVYSDIDGETRPSGGGFDIGADEFAPSLQASKSASHALVASGELVTFTLEITNTGFIDLHATVTDTLPAGVQPTGVLTWTPTITAPGGVWRQLVPVSVDAGFSGWLTNSLQVTALEGASAATSSIVQVEAPVTGLSAANDSPTPLGAATTLSATIATGTNVVYTWIFGDGTAGAGQVATHTYPQPGVYTAVVTAANAIDAVTATTTVTITAPGGPWPPGGVSITGPLTGSLNTAYLFTAETLPISTALPLTYTWQATGQSGVTNTGGLSDSVTYTWSTLGPQAITVTVKNEAGIITGAHAITITGFIHSLHLPIALRASVPVTDIYRLDGSILLDSGFCCAGGHAGQTITLTADMTATSPVTDVTHMRMAYRLAGGCFPESELASYPWVPYLTPALIPLQINHTNWIGFYASVQLRDAAGYLSPPVCDDISIEGMPQPP